MIKTGYKETELGEIPEEWELENLGSILESIFYGVTAKSTKENTDIKFLRTTDIINFNFTPRDLPFCRITEIRTNLSKYFLKNGDIIVARAGTVGISVLVKEDLNNIIFGSYLIKLKFNTAKVDPNFVHYFFQSRFYWNKIYSAQGSTIKNINIPFLKSIIIPLPNIMEQQKIAKILLDTDDLISSLDELITKKENIKTGLMQELLTKGIGHTEFKDTEVGRIPKEWEIKRLVEISKIFSGNTAPQKEEYFKNGKYAFIRVRNLTNTMICKYPLKYDLINDKAVQDLKLKKFKKGDIIFPKSGESIKLEKRAILKEDSYVVNHLAIIEPTNKINNLFLFYYINTIKTADYLVGSSMPSLQLSIIKNFPVLFPLLEEQKKIADILSDIQQEIESLEQKREKYKMIKSGLMQQLLTGKVRVK